MSVRAVAYIKQLAECPNGELVTRSEKSILWVLADAHQDRRDRHTYPSVREMAEDARISERQFMRLLDSAERKGVIQREYPQGKGRGRMTYYVFPELAEGCHNVTLFSGKRVTEGCHKGDISSSALDKQEQVQRKDFTPLPPSSGGSGATQAIPHGAGGTKPVESVAPELLAAVDRVMDSCGWTEQRLRKVIAAQVERKGRSWPGATADNVAAAMVEAWRRYCELAHLLRVPVAARTFIALGYWDDESRWPWDNAAIERERQANVGRWM